MSDLPPHPLFLLPLYLLTPSSIRLTSNIMALPTSASIENLTGKYSLNKTLSDDPDPILATVR